LSPTGNRCASFQYAPDFGECRDYGMATTLHLTIARLKSLN
jgi:hypothetical protein